MKKRTNGAMTTRPTVRQQRTTGEDGEVTSPHNPIVSRGTLVYLNPDDIEVDPGFNPRQNFALEELIPLIQQNGVQKPILVRKDERGKYLIIGGERRWRSVQFLRKEGIEIKSIPAVVQQRKLSESELLALAYLDNLGGKPFDEREEAEVFRRLVGYGWKQSEIARRFGRADSYVSQRLLILHNAEAPIADGLRAGNIPVNQAIEAIREAKRTKRSQAQVLEEMQTAKAQNAKLRKHLRSLEGRGKRGRKGHAMTHSASLTASDLEKRFLAFLKGTDFAVVLGLLVTHAEREGYSGAIVHDLRHARELMVDVGQERKAS